MKLRKELENCTNEAETNYFNGEMQFANDIFLRCLELAIKLGDRLWIAEATKNVGRILHRTGKYEEAKEKYLEALGIIDELNMIKKKPTYLNHLANVYQFLNEFEKQYESLQEALKISTGLKDQYTTAKVYNSLGVYYEIFGDYSKALDYMQKALDYFTSQENELALVKSLNLISSVKTKMGDFSGALDDAQKVYMISKRRNDLYNLAYSLRNTIRIYYNSGDREGCLNYFDELLAVKDKLENIKMNCDIFRLIGLVYQEFNQNDKAFDAFQNSLVNSKKITYYHGIAKSNEFLGDLFFKNSRFLESYRYYSNSLNVFQSIFNSIKDPSLKENYRKLFERLPDIISKVDTILNERPYDLPADELDKFSKEAINLCVQVQKQNFRESISKECSENVKQLDRNKKNEFKRREEIKREWYQIVSEECFTKLDEETQDNLVRYKLNEDRIPDDYESIIQKISKAVECEIRAKLFEGFLSYWNNEVKVQLKDIKKSISDRMFEFDYNNLKDFLEIPGKFIKLRQLYFILLHVLHRNYINRIPEEYILPFEKFREYIGINKLKILNNIIKFFDRKYKCGNKSHSFIDIRNKCSHGGGRFQEKRIKREIKIGRETFEEIQSCLINQDINLLMNFCALEL